MKTPGHKIKCCICGETKEEWGNNAMPLAKGVCCDSCNREVLLARLDAVKFDAFVKVYVEGYRAYPQSRYGGNVPYTVWPEGAAKYGHTPINTIQ